MPVHLGDCKSARNLLFACIGNDFCVNLAGWRFNKYGASTLSPGTQNPATFDPEAATKAQNPKDAAVSSSEIASRFLQAGSTS